MNIRSSIRKNSTFKRLFSDSPMLSSAPKKLLPSLPGASGSAPGTPRVQRTPKIKVVALYNFEKGQNDDLSLQTVSQIVRSSGYCATLNSRTDDFCANFKSPCAIFSKAKASDL